MARLPPIVAFAAPSGTGKTTLIEQVVRALVGRGLRVGVMKADAHRVVLDTPGKDSWRFAEAGASAVAVLSAERLALFERLDGDVTLVSAVDRLFPGVDLVLAEGFRTSGLPTIRVHRARGPSTIGWQPPVHVVAWATDAPLDTALPVLPLDDPEQVAEWIVARFVTTPTVRTPTVVCPVADPARAADAITAARRIAGALGARAMIVAGPGVVLDAPPDVTVVRDLRPGLGLLGALYTGLAAAETPEILFIGPRHWDASAARLAGLVAGGTRTSDLVYPRIDGHAEPALALYGHRCLSAIQAALLSGEFKLTGWWGQVRTQAVDTEGNDHVRTCFSPVQSRDGDARVRAVRAASRAG